MIKEAIDRIIELSKPTTFIDNAGCERFTKDGGIVIPPRMTSLELHSLESTCKQVKPENGQYAVIHLNRVSVCSDFKGNKTEFRKVDIETVPLLPQDGFKFGRRMDIEEFIIAASDGFVDDDNIRALIAGVSKISSVDEADFSDDGVSQNVTYKQGVRKQKGALEPFVFLRPYRTFAELEQPQSRFLLRISQDAQKQPFISLHEASGYGWRNEILQKTYEYVVAHVPDGTTVLR